MRKYEYETGRFTSIDPLWNKYYGWTPYQYSMNSPVGLVDFDGMKVYAIDDVSRENIINSVESDYRDLVNFKDNGEVFLKGNHNLAPLKKDLSNVTNITALEYLIKSDEIIEVSESSDYKYVNAKGEYKDGSLDWYNNDELIVGGNGATLVKYDPNIKITSQRTDVHQVIVSPNQFLSLDKNIKATKGSTAAHEMYGHLLLFLFQKNYLGHSGKVGEFIKGAESRSRE